MEVDDNPEWWCEISAVQHVPLELRQGEGYSLRNSRSPRHGFTNIFDHIAIILRAGKSPTLDNIMGTFRDTPSAAVEDFFDEGMRLESVGIFRSWMVASCAIERQGILHFTAIFVVYC